MKVSKKLKQDLERIEHLIKKSDIKAANNMDDSEEITEILQIMAAHAVPKEEVEAYVESYTTLALSLLNEPLSDIPMGRARQFLSVLDREYTVFKETFEKYKNHVCNGAELEETYKRFEATSEYLTDIMIENGDHETTYIPELDEVDYIIVDYAGCTDINVYIDAIEKSFIYNDSVIEFIHKAIETADKALLNASAICLSTTNLYMDGLVEFVRDK